MRTLYFQKNMHTDTLCVVFNSSGSAAYELPNGNLTARFEGLHYFKNLNCSVLWVAEDICTWYTRNELKILSYINTFTKNNSIKKIILLGLSGGGFASIRFACLLAKEFYEKKEIEIISIGINPRTGIRDELMIKAKDLAKKMQWEYNSQDLNAMLFKSKNYGGELFPLEKIDLAYQLDFYKKFTEQTKIFVFFDSLNPYEKIFSGDIDGEIIKKHPHELALSHVEGGIVLFRVLFEKNILGRILAL
jgi:hypothetical protein